MRIALLFLLAAFQPIPSFAAPVAQGEEIVLYQAHKGDNLYTLAQRYMLRPGDYAIVQRLNRIANPYRIPIGSTLRIPRNLLRYEPLPARILSHRGNVRILRGTRPINVSVGATLQEGDEIATAANSFLSFGLPDESVVTLPSRSRVRIARLRKLLLTGGVERLFAIGAGRARAVVKPVRPLDDFRMSTPVAVSAVRGTEFRMRYAEADARATTEVIEGAVAVSGAATALREVPAGFGATASTQGVAEATPLLPAPAMIRPGRVQDEEELVFHLEPLAGASSYHVQIAEDAGFVETVAEAFSDTAELRLPAIADGTWFVRATAVDSNGLEGRYDTHSFQRRLNRIETTIETRKTKRYREYLFRWQVVGEGERQFRFQLSRKKDGGEPIVDEPGLSTRSFVVTDLPPGTYYWRVMTLQFVDGEIHQKWSPTEQLTISRDE